MSKLRWKSQVYSLLAVIFSIYYYVWHSRSLPSVNELRPFSNYSNSLLPPRKHFTDEKYITFFTHSGFQNQLIQVENGILLAWYLNRTLLLPKVQLGYVFGWSQFDRLYQHHTARESLLCHSLKTKLKRRLHHCPDPSKYTLTSFESLIDLSWAKQHVRIEQREWADIDWLRYSYGIHYTNKSQLTGTYTDGDIMFIKDTTRYDWRMYDEPHNYKFLGKYKYTLEVDTLRNRGEKLIHFTSLFGTGKFAFRNQTNKAFFQQLQHSMKLDHPTVLNITNQVIIKLGGSYLGAHLRTADGVFKDAIPQNVQHILSRIPQRTGANDLETCVQLAQHNLTTLVYLATDATSPRNHSQCKTLWQHAPCTFTLTDLFHVEEKDRFLVPFIDALVASRGYAFVGSEGSTFSGYIRRLHQEK